MSEKYKIVEKTKIDELTDLVIRDYQRKSGLDDMYQLGQISVLNTLKGFVDEKFAISLLEGIMNTKGVSREIKNLCRAVLEKYNPNYEIEEGMGYTE